MSPLVDNQIVDYFFLWMEHSGTMATRLGAVVIMSPLMIIPGSTIFVLGALCGYLYINAQLSAKREMSLAQAPVLGHFGAAIAGLGTRRHPDRSGRYADLECSQYPSGRMEHKICSGRSRTSASTSILGLQDLSTSSISKLALVLPYYCTTSHSEDGSQSASMRWHLCSQQVLEPTWYMVLLWTHPASAFLSTWQVRLMTCLTARFQLILEN